MSSDHDDGRQGAQGAPAAWDPADGPAPSADELRDAGALARALEAPALATARARDGADAVVRDALETALRARAVYADPDDARAREAARSAAKRSVDEALARRSAAKFLAGRGRWLAIAAAGIFAVGGAGMLSLRARMDAARAPLDEGPGISRPVGGDVFSEPLPERPGARVMDRLADARMRAYRDRVLLYGSARRSR